MSSITVEGNLKDAGYSDYASKTIWFRLKDAGTDTTSDVTVVRSRVSATTDSSGDFSVTLWNNSVSGVSSVYEVLLPGDERIDFIVPDSGSTFRLEDLITNNQPSGATSQQNTTYNDAVERTNHTGGPDDLNGEKIVLDVDGDTSITADTDDRIDFEIGGVDELTLTAAKADNLDDIAALTPSDGNFIVGDGTDWVAEAGATARASLGLGVTDTVGFGNLSTQGDITVLGEKIKIGTSAYQLDRWEIFGQDVSDFVIRYNDIDLFFIGTDGAVTQLDTLFGGTVDLSGNELILDADDDTSITADTDDQIDIRVGGSDVAQVDTEGFVSGDYKALTSAGLTLSNSGGTTVATFGAGPGTGVSFAGGITLGNDLAITHGGTGASTADAALDNLGMSHKIVAAGIHDWAGGAATTDSISVTGLEATDVIQCTLVARASTETLELAENDAANDQIDLTLSANGTDTTTKICYTVLRSTS